MAEERSPCVCGATAWTLDEPPWCDVCGLPVGATAGHYARLWQHEFPPSGAIVARLTLDGIGTAAGRLKALLAAAGWAGATIAELAHGAGDGYDATYALLVRGLARRRVGAREEARRRHQGQWVAGAVRYFLRGGRQDGG